jgi:hypothetical protein
VVRVANGSTNPVDQLIAENYRINYEPFSYVTSIMNDPQQRLTDFKDVIDF